MDNHSDWQTERDLGKRIRIIRKRLKKAQRSFGEFGVQQAYLQSVETGAIKKPSPKMLDGIARGLGTTMPQLLAGTEVASRYQSVQPDDRTFCPNNDCPKLALNRYDTGMIIPFRFSMERTQIRGDETYVAVHCPYCGTEMINSCRKCGKPILVADPLQTHCVICGEQLFDRITEETMKAKGFR